WPFVPPALAGLLCLALLLALVEFAVRADIIPRSVVAQPSRAIAGLVTLQNRPDLRDGFLITFRMTAIPVVVERLVGLPLCYFLFLRRDFALAYSGWLAALFAAPIFLLYPLFLVIFGRNEITLIIMGFLPGVIPLIIQVAEGFRGVSSTLI